MSLGGHVGGEGMAETMTPAGCSAQRLRTPRPEGYGNRMNREQALQIGFDQARLLLATAALRTAPQGLHELSGGSNSMTRNAAYLHPDALRMIGFNVPPGVQRLGPCLIVCTKLMPRFGVIYGPLFNIFLAPDQRPEDFMRDFNVAMMHPEAPHAAQMLEQGRAALEDLGRRAELTAGTLDQIHVDAMINEGGAIVEGD